jgi:hypothetical protein
MSMTTPDSRVIAHTQSATLQMMISAPSQCRGGLRSRRGVRAVFLMSQKSLKKYSCLNQYFADLEHNGVGVEERPARFGEKAVSACLRSCFSAASNYESGVRS